MQLFTPELLKDIDRVEQMDYFSKIVPVRRLDYSTELLADMTRVFAQVIDYKSPFTKHHSLGVADKAKIMGRYYGYDKEKQDCLYIAGALHDVGKLAIHNSVLEKPGKLTEDEFKNMKNHAWQTWYILSQIEGFEEITEWASLHHEKLNGKGYPFGKTADELSHEDRLLACIDIYQALTEKRPYKDGMTHEAAMTVLDKMAGDGQIDQEICHDLEVCFGTENGKDAGNWKINLF